MIPLIKCARWFVVLLIREVKLLTFRKSAGRRELSLARGHYNVTIRNPLNFTLPAGDDRWGDFQKLMSKKIQEFKTSLDAISWAQEFQFDDRRNANVYHIILAQKAHTLVRNDFPNTFSKVVDIEESKYTPRKKLFYIGKILASSGHYVHLYHMTFIINAVQNFTSICEIGGGYGNLARMFFLNKHTDVKSYWLIDIPETLFQAEIFLRMSLPKLRIIYIEDENMPIEPCSDGNPTLYLCPIAFSEITKNFKFDILINTGSLPELPEAWQQFWQEWIEKQNVRYFYSCNIFGNDIRCKGETRTYFSPRVGSKWTVIKAIANPSIWSLYSFFRNWGAILFEKDINEQHIDKGYFIRNKHLRLSREQYIIAFYDLIKSDDLDLQMQFIQKVRDDFDYVPAELVYLAKKIGSDPKFSTLSTIQQDQIKALEAWG